MPITYKRETASDGTEVVATYLPLDPWGVELVAAVAVSFGRKPGEHFVADLLKVDRLFPPDWHPAQRRERVNRLFASPVQADDLLFALESSPGRMYQKTKKLVARPGVLDASTPTSQTGVGKIRAASTRLNALAIVDEAQYPRDDLLRLVEDVVETNKALAERLNAVETEMLSNGMTLDGTKFHTSEERIAKVRARIGLLDHDFGRLAEAVKEVLPALNFRRMPAPGGVEIEGDDK